MKRKVNLELPEKVLNYTLALNVFEELDERNVGWVEYHAFEKVIAPERSSAGSFAGYLDADGQPVAGYFVWEAFT